MKSIINITSTFLSIIILFNSCKEDLPEYFRYEPFAYSKNDTTAGIWKSIVVADVNTLAIPAPYNVGSTEYLADLAELKTNSANPTGDQLDQIKYWSGDGIARWNEIARDFISKYNLPPAPNADGTYPGANSATPDKYPYFPFSHPTYSCRALAYLAGAQYDALIAAWNLKYKYNIPTRNIADPTIKNSLPETTLPSYPSEGAVVASVSKSLLIALFPIEKAKIEQLATDHINSLQWAGRNTKSDVKAGDSLGVLVANEFKKRMSSDGMKNAQTSKPISDSIKNVAFTTFGWSWKNLETPERPVGITPLFGKLKTWFIPNVESVRPGPPPAIGSAEFNIAAEELKSISKNLTLEQRKLAYFYADGLGTYSPPGHWNRIAIEHIVSNKLSPVRAARVLAFMNYSIMDAGISCWDAKYFYHYPRPAQVISGFKTLLGTPNFPSYTSGHSCFSAAAATVLTHFFKSNKIQFEKISQEAALSRIYGGIHFRFDSEAGNTSGIKIGEFSVNRAILDSAE